jgi:hypothetical protein
MGNVLFGGRRTAWWTVDRGGVEGGWSAGVNYAGGSEECEGVMKVDVSSTPASRWLRGGGLSSIGGTGGPAKAWASLAARAAESTLLREDLSEVCKASRAQRKHITGAAF